MLNVGERFDFALKELKITNKEIAESLEVQFSIIIDKKNISVDKKFKSVGIYEVDCKLGHSIHATLKVDIIGE